MAASMNARDLKPAIQIAPNVPSTPFGDFGSSTSSAFPLWGRSRFAFGSTLQKRLPAMDLNSAFQLAIELVKAAPQNFNLVLIESGH